MKEKTYETIIEMLTEALELQKWRYEQLEAQYRSLFKVNDALLNLEKSKEEMECHPSTAE